MTSNWKLEIDLAELSAAFEIVLGQLREIHGDKVTLTDDYYWSLRPYESFEPGDSPKPTIGSYVETWDNLKHERNNDDEIVVPFSAVWLGEILVALGLAARPSAAGPD